ncbi:MAG TPA: DUF5305 domain-containing protein [Clostridiaceae bacterium]|nr:DUF5305 domain-containing protein [Clostridiaceae bacterium]
MDKQKEKKTTADKWIKIKIRLCGLPNKTLIFIIIVWIIITIITVHAFSTSQVIELKTNKNIITQRTVFDYKTKELPNGVIGAEGIIFPKTQSFIDVYIETTITAIESVNVKGNYSILLKIIAEGLWERAETLKEKQYFNNEGESIEVINQKVSIDLEKIFNDIEVISNEIIGSRPTKFFINIIPVIEGDITYESNKIDIESNMVMKFELSPTQVTFNGDEEYLKQIPIEEIEVIENKINLFGLMVPIRVYRYISLPIFLIFTSFILLILILKRQIRIEQMTEVDEIERKYKNRLVPIQQPIDYKNKTHIPLESMEALVRISDEQDRGIFKYRSDIEGKIFYYVIEDNYIYTYTIDTDNNRKNIINTSIIDTDIIDTNNNSEKQKEKAM